jgi:hypothetical protein
MRVRGIAAACALCATALGCASKVATVTLFSTRNVEMSQPHERMPRASESDSRLWLLFIPLGSAPSGLQAAVDLLEDEKADYLTNAEVSEGGWTLLAVSMGWVTVEADPWRRSAAPKSSGSQEH